MLSKLILTTLLSAVLFTSIAQKQKNAAPTKADTWKKEVMTALDQKYKTAQEMVDMVFSFSELGFQETETSAYLTKILEQNGFTIERGISGIPLHGLPNGEMANLSLHWVAILIVYLKHLKN